MVGAEGSTWTMLRMYSGNGSLMLLFLAALVYLWIAEKNKGIKAILVYVSLAVYALFFCPLVSHFMINVMDEEEIYYRILWMLPMGMVIAYAAVKFLGNLKKKWIKAVLAVALVAFILVGGHCVYKSPQFSKAQNVYQIPDAVVHICDAIQVPGREVMAVFPHELVQYVRQYTAFVKMPYGYDALVERWNLGDELEEEMRKEISSAERLATLAREDSCHFIIINQGHVLDGVLADYEYDLILQTDGYDVYRDRYADLRNYY